MVAATQLALFSHPQPLVVILHTGVIWPYQLHCWAVATLEALDAAELGVELATELEATAELAAELEL